jgi:hypothetical protein
VKRVTRYVKIVPATCFSQTLRAMVRLERIQTKRVTRLVVVKTKRVTILVAYRVSGGIVNGAITIFGVVWN